MLDRLFGWSEGKDKPQITYDQEKEVAGHPNADVRQDLASRHDARPEILYFLATDKSSAVRRAVAENPTSPRQAEQLLASDSDDEVRIVLAHKIGRLIPEIDSNESSKLQDLTIEILSTLAQDQLPKVRQIISEEIKSAANVPRDIVARLARDVESVVSAPVLQYSVLLTDDDLLEVVTGARQPEVLASVSRRPQLSSAVCDAIVATGDETSIASLLANHGAQIREETLDRVIGAAPAHQPWHQPLVRRPSLSAPAVRRIAGFVAAALLDELAARADLDADTERYVRQRVRDRLKEEDDSTSSEDAAARARAKNAFAAGKLDDEAVMIAAQSNDQAFIAEALGLRSSLTADIVRGILSAKSNRAPRRALLEGQLGDAHRCGSAAWAVGPKGNGCFEPAWRHGLSDDGRRDDLVCCLL